MAAEPAPESQRIDRFLWFARLDRSRSAAQALCEKGHVRLDGRRVDRAHAPVRIGSVLSLPLPAGVRVIRVERLPHRRGPAPEAAGLYRDLTSPPERNPPIDEARGRE